VGRDLPSADLDRFESSLHLLHGLVAAHRAQRVHVPFGFQEIPEPLRAHAGQDVLKVVEPR
jgi:hypothetical protein